MIGGPGAHESVVLATGASLRIHHPEGTFAPSPATRLMARVVGGPAVSIGGIGVDWGCGTGVLSIAVALRTGVRRVIGLDRSGGDVRVARENAHRNGVGESTAFHVSDSYRPVDPEARREVESLRGRLDFVIANPPASRGDDGFTNRHVVVSGAMERLRPGGVVILQALSAYGPERFRRLAAAVPQAEYGGIVGTTRAVPLAMEGPGGIGGQLIDYAAEEARGGPRYHLEDEAGRSVTATESLRRLETTGTLPWGRWQAHRFLKRDPDSG